MNTPNRDYDHVFAIIRFDSFQLPDAPPDELVTIKMIVWDQEVAEQEVARLNSLNAGKGSVYFWQMTRLAKSTTSNVWLSPSR